MKEKTLKKTYFFEGKGLHTGTYSHMAILPAPAGSGIVFCRTDLPSTPFVPALAENVSNTARSTTISVADAKVVTTEHILSALHGLGVDNAYIELDNLEVPILDGSARLYAEAILADGLEEQDAERNYIDLPYSLEVKDEKTGAWVRFEKADSPSMDITVDFNSNVLGVQSAHWDEGTAYEKEIAPCRTFCFFKEVEGLVKQGLIKGGDLDNALVITDEGYMGNPTLHFTDECGRHKLLDLIGDMTLCGGYLNARVSAFKSGHAINTKAAKALRAILR